jgi:hypothetical protein
MNEICKALGVESQWLPGFEPYENRWQEINVMRNCLANNSKQIWWYGEVY